MFIDIDGKQIHYERQGRGEHLLLVHGWGGSSKSLMPLFQVASKHFDTIVVDLPGFGESDDPNPKWGMLEYGLILHNLIQKLDLQKVHYFGHSFGGGLGMFLATQYPHEINTLILCNSAFRRDKKISLAVKGLKQKILTKLPFYTTWEALMKKIVYNIFFPNSDLTKFPQLESNFRKIITQDFVGYAPLIKRPTLILWGEEDTYTPVRYATELHELIKDSELKIYPGKRHNLPLVHPKLIFEEINTFCKREGIQ